MSSLPSSLRKGKGDIATQINQIDQKLSKKEKGSFLYLVEVLAKEADPSKSLIVLLGDLRHKYCHEKDDSIDILRIILEKAKLKKYADILCPPNQFRPPTLENYQYISEHECKLVAMRSCIINLVCSLSKDLLRILLETLCLKSDSNSENYTCIYVLLRELEQKAIISPGKLEYISEVLEEDDRFTSVRNILVDYQEQFCNDEGQRRSSTGNNPVCPSSNQLPRAPLHAAGPHSLRAFPPPPAQQPLSVPHPPRQMRGGPIQRQISVPPLPPHPSQSSQFYQSGNFQHQVPMNLPPDRQRDQFVQPAHQNQRHHSFDQHHSLHDQQHSRPNRYHQPPDQYHEPSDQHHSLPSQSRRQSDQYHQPPDQYHEPPDQHHSLPSQSRRQSDQYHQPPDQYHEPPEQHHSLSRQSRRQSDQYHQPPDQYHEPPDQHHSLSSQSRRQSDQYHQPPDQYHEPPDQHHSLSRQSRRQSDQYHQPPDQYHEPPDQHHSLSSQSRRQSDQYHQPPDQYHEPPDQHHSLSRQSRRQSDQYHQPPDQYHEPPHQSRRQSDQYHQPPDQYRQPSDQHHSRPDQYRQPPDQYRQPPDQYRQPPDQHQSRSDQYCQPPDQYRQPPNQHQSRPDQYHQPPNRHQSRPDQYRQSPDWYHSRPDQYHQLPDQHHQSLDQNCRPQGPGMYTYDQTGLPGQHPPLPDQQTGNRLDSLSTRWLQPQTTIRAASSQGNVDSTNVTQTDRQYSNSTGNWPDETAGSTVLYNSSPGGAHIRPGQNSVPFQPAGYGSSLTHPEIENLSLLSCTPHRLGTSTPHTAPVSQSNFDVHFSPAVHPVPESLVAVSERQNSSAIMHGNTCTAVHPVSRCTPSPGVERASIASSNVTAPYDFEAVQEDGNEEDNT